MKKQQHQADALPAATFTAHPQRRTELGLLLRLVSSGPVLVLIALLIAFAILTPRFLTASNLTNVLIQSSVTAILSLGIFLVVMVGELDLSVGATVGLATVAGAVVFRDAPELGWLVVPVMIGTGLLAGLFNALVIVVLRLGNSFIVTLGTLYMFQSLAYVAAGASQIPGMPDGVLALANERWLGIPGPIWLVAACGLALAFVLRKLVLGRWIVALGGNRVAGDRMGIPARGVLISVFVLAGLFAGIAAVLVAGRANAGYPQPGNSILFAIAAVVIGGASLTGGRGTVIGTLVGAVSLGVLQNGLALLAIDPNWTPFAIGAVLVAAVGIDYLRTRVEASLRLRQALLTMTGGSR